MGRYQSLGEIDKAKELEEHVQKLASKTNKSLVDVSLKEVKLILQEPFVSHGTPFFNGFVSMGLIFDSKEPPFLTTYDQACFYNRIREIKKEKFGSYGSGVDWLTIDFSEPTEEELYVLTQRKKEILEGGFGKAKNYAEIFCLARESYKNLVKNQADERTKAIRRFGMSP